MFIISDSSFPEPNAMGFTQQRLHEKMVTMPGITLKEARDRTEREIITSAIENQGGNMAKAAEMLGISRPTLYDLVRKHGLSKSTNQVDV